MSKYPTAIIEPRYCTIRYTYLQRIDIDDAGNIYARPWCIIVRPRRACDETECDHCGSWHTPLSIGDGIAHARACIAERYHGTVGEVICE